MPFVIRVPEKEQLHRLLADLADWRRISGENRALKFAGEMEHGRQDHAGWCRMISKRGVGDVICVLSTGVELF